MKEFIDYFWKNKGFKYDPNGIRIFGWYHNLMMLIVVVVFVAFWFIGRKIKKKERLLVVVSLLLLVLETLRVVNLYFYFKKGWFEALNFHVCSFGVYIGIIAGLVQKRVVFEAMFIAAMIGGTTAVIIPYGILPWWNMFSFIPLQSYLSHILIVFMIVYALKTNIFKADFKRVYIPIVVTTIMVIGIHFLNLFLFKYYPSSYSNYFWTRFPDPLFPVINKWVFPYHFIFLTSVFLVLGVFLFYIASLYSKRKASRLKSI